MRASRMLSSVVTTGSRSGWNRTITTIATH